MHSRLAKTIVLANLSTIVSRAKEVWGVMGGRAYVNNLYSPYVKLIFGE